MSDRDPGDEQEHATTCQDCGRAMRYVRQSVYLDIAWCRGHRLPVVAVILLRADSQGGHHGHHRGIVRSVILDNAFTAMVADYVGCTLPILGAAERLARLVSERVPYGCAADNVRRWATGLDLPGENVRQAVIEILWERAA